MNILVFGGGGYIGIPLAQQLAGQGHQVTAADRFYFSKCPQNCYLLRADIRTFKFPEGLIQRGIPGYDVVIDLCGLSNDACAEIDPDLTRSINLDGAMRLADAAKAAGVEHYIYASSCSVYGHGTDIGLKESAECKPLTLYAQYKLMVEDYLRAIADKDFQPVILRNATVFGYARRMRFDLVVNAMTLRAWKDHLIYVMGGGDQWRPLVHINDVCSVICTILEKQVRGETFNVGSDKLNVQIYELADMVAKEFPYAVRHVIPDNPDQRSYNVSFAKINGALFSSWRDIRFSGIRDIVANLEANPDLANDPTTITVAWYKELLSWKDRIDALRLDGILL
jgi:nucleoside-diphosphate-sugar epimerase